MFTSVVRYLPSPETRFNIFWLFLMLSACFLRMSNLGQLGLWGDEGYTAISVLAILEHGYPLLPSGGIYSRAFVFSYLEALSAKLFGLNEFALRFPNTIFGLAGIWMTYFLGKTLYEKRVGYLAAILMTFSIWEITFSRYARVYVFFQLFYLLSIYIFYRGFINGERFYQWLTAPVWMLTVTIHQLGLSLAPLLLTPFFIKEYHHVKKWVLICGFAGLALFWKLYKTFQVFLRPSVAFTTHTGKELTSKSPIAVPPLNLLFQAFERNQIIFYIMLSIAILCISFLIRTGFSKPEEKRHYWSVILIVLACFFHQIALAFVLLMFYSLLFFKSKYSWRGIPFLLAVTLVLFSLLAWISYGLSQEHTMRRIISLLFQYPYLHERFLRFFISGWPLVTLLTGLGLFLSWYSFIVDRRRHGLLFGFASLVGPLLLMSIAYRGDDEARYSFHLYPLMLILSAYGFTYLSGRFVPLKRRNWFIPLFLIFMFLIPGDFQLDYAAAISKNEYGKEIGQVVKTPGHYRFHPDYKTPSHYIKSKVEEGDVIISMLEAIPVYYVGRIDYLWIPTENDKANMRRYGFTGKLPKIRFSDLESLLKENTGTHFWLLKDQIPVTKLKKNEIILEFLKVVSLCQVFEGSDGKTAVYHFYADEMGHAVCVEE